MSSDPPDKFLAALDTEGVVETREPGAFVPPTTWGRRRQDKRHHLQGSPLLTFFKRNWKNEIFSSEPCKL